VHGDVNPSRWKGQAQNLRMLQTQIALLRWLLLPGMAVAFECSLSISFGIQVEGLGRIPFSSIRRPRPLLEVSGPAPTKEVSRDGHTPPPPRPLEQEPMLAARIAIEDGMCLLLVSRSGIGRQSPWCTLWMVWYVRKAGMSNTLERVQAFICATILERAQGTGIIDGNH
jgi:hypothetical protein